MESSVDNINVFENGGVIDLSSTNNQMSDLGKAMMTQYSNYDENLEKYQERLAPFAYQPRKMNIYDLASELGAGLLSTPNTGGASAYTGLGVGFNRASERMKAAKAENEKARQQIGLQAAQMAMQDEKSALEFIKEYELKNLDYKNKRGDLLTFEYTDESGELVRKTVRDNIANDDIIETLITDRGAVEVKTPGSVVNVGSGNKVSKRDEEAIKRQYAAEDEILAKQRAGVSSVANVNEAIDIAQRLGPENFGTVARATLYPRKLLSGLGITDDNKENILGDQILLSQISLGFTMDIVSRTKGAISNREMEMFEKASPGLGSNYNGFMKQAEYLKRVAQRDVDFFNAYTDEADRLEALEDAGELRPSQVKRKLDKFEGDWYNENLIFSKDEYDELEAIASGNYTDQNGIVYTIPEGFNADEWRKNYREGQDASGNNKSSYTLNKNPAIDAFERKREQIKLRTDLLAEQKQSLYDAIDKQIENLQ
mgnify:FL=1|tara:strand:+ start:166 stop:1617 length:1452 start_codon:yes stop_codon:yes gene_type:complete